jgi:cobalt-zinc-cadmium efflux system membrane fusion protein
MTTPDDAPPPALPRALPRATQLKLLAAVAAALVLGAVLLALFGRGPVHQEEAALAPGSFRPTAVQLKTLAIEPVLTHRFVPIEVADGRIAVNAERATPVFSPYSGRVTALIAKPGDRVAAGAALATIEASELADAQGAYQTAAGQAAAARAGAARKRALLEANGASRQDVEQAEAELAAAEGALAAARDHLRILGQSEAAIAALASGAAGDARTALHAPIAGVVLERQLGPGQYLTAGGGTAVFTIADLSTLWIVGTLSERAAPRLKPGRAVEVTTPAWPGRRFRARLDFVAPAIDPASHRLTVRALIDNADGALRPEMLATLRVEAGEASENLAVPAAAVVYDGARAHVWVAATDGLLTLRQIRTGERADGLVEVLEGLAAGERVVTKGSLFIDSAARLD